MAGGAQGRTYSIWIFIGLFSFIALAGLVGLLVAGGSNDSTVQLMSPQTLPDDAAETEDPTGSTSSSPSTSSTASTTSTPSTTTTTEPELPVPEGVVDVQRQQGSTSFVFEAPSNVDPTSLEAIIAPMAVGVDPAGTTATLQIGCARSSEEFLAQVLVTDDDRSVTFAAVALSAPGGPPCPAGAELRRVELTLPRPLDGRAVVVVPRGTDVPPIQPS
jgi:hypothetical protein